MNTRHQNHYEIRLHAPVTMVEKYNIPPTPLKYVPVGKSTIDKEGVNSVALSGSDDKRAITAPIPLDDTQSLPKFKFPFAFSLSVNEKNFSNKIKAMKYLQEVIIPYV